jgi:predicted P-loop ATPase
MLNILQITQNLNDCNQYIQQLEAQNKQLYKNLQKTKKDEQKKKYKTRMANSLRPIHDMARFIESEYLFRHNVIHDIYEFKPRKEGAQWYPVDNRQMNTIMNRVQDDGGVLCLKSLVMQRIKSTIAVDYHPVRDYLDSIRGTWDGQDRIEDLCSRINKSDYCRRMIHQWLLAMVAQWLGIDTRHANAVMLLLVSPRQGLQKSTFLHELLPKQLSSYYTDDFSLNSKGNADRKLVEFALINIDEFDKMPVKKMPDLKTLMQTLRPSFVKAYKTTFNQLPRIASFAGTSNERQLLTDRTGSRRFLILEPDDVIRVDGICHDQIYAQLLHEMENGRRYYFTKEEESEMQTANQAYYKLDPLEKLFTQFYRKPETDEKYQLVSASQLMDQLQKKDGLILHAVSQTTFIDMLKRLGFSCDHRHYGNFYRVVPL